MECVVFPNTYDEVSEELNEDAIVSLSGKVDERNDSLQLIVDDVEIFDESEDIDDSDKPTGSLVVLELEDMAWQQLNRLAGLFRDFRGSDQVVLKFYLGGRVRTMRVGYEVDWCRDLQTAVEECLGDGRVDRVIAQRASSSVDIQLTAD